MTTAPFDMPQHGSWEDRGGWVVRRLSLDLSLDLQRCAGIVGNLGFESAGFTTLHEIGQPEGRGGYGWGQWTADRRKTFFAYCTQQHLPIASDEGNYGYLLHELTGAYKATVAALRRFGVITLEDAVFSVGQTYERPGGTTDDYLPGFSGRLHWARRALAGAQGSAPLPEHDPTLRKRDSGEEVERLQGLLAKVLGIHLAQDGNFGNWTEAAVKTYQARAGLMQDGVCGPLTWAALEKDTAA